MKRQKISATVLGLSFITGLTSLSSQADIRIRGERAVVVTDAEQLVSKELITDALTLYCGLDDSEKTELLKLLNQSKNFGEIAGELEKSEIDLLKVARLIQDDLSAVTFKTPLIAHLQSCFEDFIGSNF